MKSISKTESLQPSWERHWLDALKARIEGITEEAANRAAREVYAHVKRIGAEAAVELARTAEVTCKGEAITIRLIIVPPKGE